MALKKVPDGGFYVDDSQVSVDYAKKSISIVGGGTGGGGLSLDGGTMNADAVINGTEELQITTADTSESGTVGITPQGVTLVHNTNSAADSRIRAIENSVEIMANGTTVTLNGTGVNFGGGALSNIASIGASSSAIAFENDMDMNSHNILNIHGMNFVGQDIFIDCENGAIFISTNENDLSTVFGIVNGNTDTDAIFQSGIMYKNDYFNGTLVINNNLNTFDGTTSYFGKQSTTSFDTFEGLTVDSNGVVTIKSNSPISFNNGIITNVANPVNNTDVVNKQYADATYASVSSVPTNATTSQAGIVKQISNIAQLEASSASTEQIATTLNNLLTALQNAGIMSAN